MQTVVVSGALHRAVLQRDPNRVAAVIGVHRVRRIRILRPRNQRLSGGLILRGHAHDAVGPALCVVAVNLVRRNITVPPQVAGPAGTAPAILDRVPVSVNFDPFSRGINTGQQSKVIAPQRAHSGDLPATDEPVRPRADAAAQKLAAAERQIDDPVPSYAVFGDAGVPLVVQEAISFVEIGGHPAGQELVQFGDDRGAAVALPPGGQGISYVVENLKTVAFAVVALQLQLDAVIVRPAGFPVFLDRAPRPAPIADPRRRCRPAPGPGR